MKEDNKIPSNNNENLISMFSSIYFELQKDINNIAKTLELVENNLKKLEESRNKNDVATEELKKDLNNSFNKLREILDILKDYKLEKLYEDIIDMNNKSSLSNKITDLFAEQNKSLIDLNNPKSVVSVLKDNNSKTMTELKKSNNVRTTITWILVSIATVVNILYTVIKN